MSQDENSYGVAQQRDDTPPPKPDRKTDKTGHRPDRAGAPHVHGQGTGGQGTGGQNTGERNTGERKMAKQAAAACSLAAVVRAGEVLYERRRHLPGLARATMQELESNDSAVGRTIVARLMQALRNERQRGRAGHWSYDINRHIALTQAVRAERKRLRVRRGGRTRSF